MKKSILFAILMATVVSCSNNNHFDLGSHETKTLVIDPSKQHIMDKSEYDIVDVISLDLPSGVSTIIPKDIQIANDHLYMLDAEANRTVFMFDMSGNFVCQMGRLGHAKNEYIKRPESLSIDEKTGVAYIYERASRRILKFDSNGRYMDSMALEESIPGSFAVTENNSYIFCFENNINGGGSQLSLYNNGGLHIKSFLPAPQNPKLYVIGKPIYKCKDKISYYPYLADSVIVFSGDSVDYTIKIDFCGQFVSEEARNRSMAEGTYDPLYKHNGVQFIDQFELTDSIIHVGYAYHLSRSHFVKNLCNGKTFNTTFGPLFGGYCPVCDFFVHNDKLLFFIDEEDVDLLLQNEKGRTYDQIEAMRGASKQIMLDIMDKKYKFPLIMMVKLR